MTLRTHVNGGSTKSGTMNRVKWTPRPPVTFFGFDGPSVTAQDEIGGPLNGGIKFHQVNLINPSMI